jgi:exodeoxyribonuclease VII small subunit
MVTNNPAEKKFETALEELEGVVEQLESGELSLEEALAAFEKGVGLVKYCNQKLADAERKVELLVRNKEGKLKLKVLDSISEDDSQE